MALVASGGRVPTVDARPARARALRGGRSTLCRGPDAAAPGGEPARPDVRSNAALLRRADAQPRGGDAPPRQRGHVAAPLPLEPRGDALPDPPLRRLEPDGVPPEVGRPTPSPLGGEADPRRLRRLARPAARARPAQAPPRRARMGNPQ